MNLRAATNRLEKWQVVYKRDQTHPELVEALDVILLLVETLLTLRSLLEIDPPEREW